MTMQFQNVFQTRFNMFVPCSYETYKKLMKISFYFHHYALPFSNRWHRAQKRQSHNRYFKRPYRADDGRRQCERRPVTDQWLCPLLFSRDGLTPLGKVFLADRANVTSPVKAAADVKPLVLTDQQIDQLLNAAEVWHKSI